MGEHMKDERFMAWYGLLQVEARSTELIGREIERETGLPMTWFELLANLEGLAELGRPVIESAAPDDAIAGLSSP